MAIAADTVIVTLHRTRTAEKLARIAGPFYGFAWDGHAVTVSRVELASAIRTAPTFRVVFDDGASIRVTDDQLVAYKEGGCGSPFTTGQTLLPLITGRTKDSRTGGKPTFMQMGTRHKKAPRRRDRCPTREVCRMVYEWKTGELITKTGRVVHADGDVTNCNPENLSWQHQTRAPAGDALRALVRATKVELPRYYNHKVVGVEPFGEEPVVDVLAAEHQTFGAGGVFMVVGEAQVNDAPAA